MQAQIPPAALSGMKLSVWGLSSQMKEKVSKGHQIRLLQGEKECVFLCWQAELMGCPFSEDNTFVQRRVENPHHLCFYRQAKHLRGSQDIGKKGLGSPLR